MPRRYIPLALIATFLWGSAFAGAKIGFEYLPPLLLSGLRFTLSGILLLPIAWIIKTNWRSLFKQWRFILLFGFIQTFLQYGLFFMGLDKVPGAVAAIIIGAGPLFVCILAHFSIHDDRFTLKKSLSLILGLAGIVLISLRDSGLTSNYPQFYQGVILLIISNIIGSSTNIIVVKRKNPISPVALTLGANLSGGLMLILCSVIFETLPVMPMAVPAELIWALLWLAFIPACAFSLWYYILGRPDVKVSELNMWKFFIPIVGALLSWWLLPGEYPQWRSVIGIVIISSSIIALQWPSQRRRQQRNEPAHTLPHDTNQTKLPQ